MMISHLWCLSLPGSVSSSKAFSVSSCKELDSVWQTYMILYLQTFIKVGRSGCESVAAMAPHHGGPVLCFSVPVFYICSSPCCYWWPRKDRGYLPLQLANPNRSILSFGEVHTMTTNIFVLRSITSSLNFPIGIKNPLLAVAKSEPTPIRPSYVHETKCLQARWSYEASLSL
jgi:hypothetical protein